MVSSHTSSHLWLVRLSASWTNQGGICSGHGLMNEAMEAFETSLRFLKPLKLKVPASAGLLNKWLSTYDKLGEIYFEQKLQRKARRVSKAAMEIRKKLADLGVY